MIRLHEALLILLVAHPGILFGQGTYKVQPELKARSINTLSISGFQFKDFNKNHKLDAYEDWRLPVDLRIEGLLKEMTLAEKVGMLLINTLNAEAGGKVSRQGVALIEDEKMTRFIFRNVITNSPRPTGGGPFGGAQVTPFEAAQFMNSVQEIAESTRLGIPLLFKSNARNHIDFDARAGINAEPGAFSSWPKEGGLAATRDLDLIADFGKIMAAEWTSVGLRGMYGYVGDLATEPRWYRVHETFSEDADLTANIISTLVKSLQGPSLGQKSVALTIKHFPGGGPQEGGLDPHYAFGKNQIYPADKFDYHLKPFQAAISAGASSIMAYYGIPIGQPYMPNDVGMAFSKGILTDLLRNKLAFKGYINSDTGIIGSRAWGLEDKSTEEQILIAIDAGTDVLSGFSNNKQLLSLVTSGKLAESRVDLSVRRLLKEQFELGLFEDPYVDPARAAYLLGNASFQRKADIAQRKSIVLLQNKNILPLPASKPGDSLQLFTMGIDSKAFSKANWTAMKVVSGDYDRRKGQTMPAIPANIDYAIINIHVVNDSGPELPFGGAVPEEVDLLAFSDMAKAKSWKVTPSVADIQQVMKTIGAAKTILAISFRQPYVIDQASGFRNAGAILATFGVSDAALLDVISGKFQPSGKLPFALANKARAVVDQQPDAPGYPKEDTLFPFGFGLSY